MRARLAWIAAATIAAIAGGVVLRRSPPASGRLLGGTLHRLRRTVSDDWDDLFI